MNTPSADTMESPLRGNTHGGFGERPGETDREQSRHRAPGRLNWRRECGLMCCGIRALLAMRRTMR